MNPIRISKEPITTGTFDSIMEDAFSNALGMRKNCGARPLRHAPRYWGKGGASLFTAENAGYQKCINQLRDLNVSAGMPVDTGIPQDSGLGNNENNSGGKVSDSGTSQSGNGKKIAIAIGATVGLVLLFAVVIKATKSKAPKIIAE